MVLVTGYVLYLCATTKHGAPSDDGYVNYAYSIEEWGVFGPAKDSGSEPRADFGRAPLYPLFLASMMRLSPTYKAMAVCYIDGRPHCSWADANFVHAVQIVLMIAALALLYQTCLVIGARPWISAVTAALAAPALLTFTYKFRMSEDLAIPLVALFGYAIALWFAGRSGWRALALAGIALALLALTRLAYVYFGPPIALAVFLIPPRRAEDGTSPAPLWRGRLAGALVLLAGFMATLAPWYARNAVRFDRLTLGEAAGNEVLATRLVYDRMGLIEGLASIGMWLPDPVPNLTTHLVSDEVARKFDLNEPTGFRQRRHDHLIDLQAHHSKQEIRHILVHEILAQPFRHLAMSIPFAVRGLHDIWMFVPLAVWQLIGALRRRQWWLFGIAAFPILNLLFHALLTHFRARYGVPMLFGLAPLTALQACMLVDWFRVRRSTARAQAYHPNTVL